jgi:DNA-binding response OmpR family regulator
MIRNYRGPSFKIGCLFVLTFWEAFDRSLDIAISRIRKKLKLVHEGEFIKTVRLKGYMFINED